MDHTTYVSSHTARIADAVASQPDAEVAVYAPWTVADLARHVGQIHRWVTTIVGDRLEERPPFPTPEIEDADLADWLVAGADALTASLRATEPSTPLWSFDRADRTAGFWHRRMALETVHHAWDADTALGRPTDVPGALATAGVEEVLRVYTAPALRKVALEGGDRRVAVVPTGSAGWTVTLHDVGMGVEDGSTGAGATITGDPVTLWLLLTDRAGLDEVTVDGDPALAQRLVELTQGIPGPTG